MTERPITTLFMLESLDGKISSGNTDLLDADRDWCEIPGVKEGLHQYYEIEATTDYFSLNTGRVKEKIGVNERKEYHDKVEPVLTGKNGAKPVLQLDPKTNKIINIYDSASAAARALGLSRPTGISKCCNGNSKISAGYKWQFLQSSTTKDH